MGARGGLAGVAAMLFGFVLLRGLSLGTVQMPFEGWDEYAHLAVAAHVALHDEMPAPTDSVPEVLWPFLRLHPHPPGSAAHCAGLGALRYDQWPIERLVPLQEPQPPLLYQAQHGPLFYYLMAAMWQGTDAHELSAWADTGRIVNSLCVAGAAVCWLYALSACLGEGGRALAIAASIAVAANSLVLYNGVRVANDALALALAAVAFLMYCHTLRRPASGRLPVVSAVVVGGLLGAAALAKANAMALLPLVVFGAMRARSRHGERIGVGALLLVAYLAVAGWYHVNAWLAYGAIVPMQEAAYNAAQGRGLLDVLASLPQLEWDRVQEMLVLGTLRGGGWSSVPLPQVFTGMYRTLLLLGVLCTLFVGLQPDRRRALGTQVRAAWELPALVVLVWGAVLFHALQSQTAWGYPTTGARYGVLGMPALLTLVLLGAAHMQSRMLLIGAGAITVLFSVVYYVETFGELVPFQTVGLASGLAAGIAEIQVHHALLRWPVLPSVLAEGVLVLGMFASLHRAASRTT